MNDVKHTPGPWTVTSAGKVKGADGRLVALVWFQQPNSAPRTANDSLIAAAPDLLAALKKALAESVCDEGRCLHAWHALARAAVAKAESRS